MLVEYYQKNPSAVASLRGALYEEKILDLLKNKIKLINKNVTLKEAEQILKEFTQQNKVNDNDKSPKNRKKSKNKKKK